jgi:MOSC domain-containing protein YiiM
VTGLRNPCRQIDAFARGLTAAALGRDAEGHIFRKAGVMAVVTRGGDVKPGDEITLELPTIPSVASCLDSHHDPTNPEVGFVSNSAARAMSPQ